MRKMKKTELKPKSVSLVLVALLLCSIFTGAMGTDVSSNAVLRDQPSTRGNLGYESWYYYVADMVSSANGNLYLSEKDISIKARGFDLEIIRSYNSHSSEINSTFGFGWTYNYNLKLVENPDDSVTMFDEDGSVHNFISVGEGEYDSPSGLHLKLTKNHVGSFILRFKDGSKYNFDSHGTLLSIIDKNDNHLTFSYTDGKLTRIADDSELALTLNYNADDRISSIVDPLARPITYEYNDSDLVKVTDARGNSSLYLYYDNHKLEGVVNRVDSMLLFSYYEESRADRVKTIKKSLYDRTEEVYLDPFTLYSFSYNDRTTYATDAMGHTTEIEVNDLGNPVKITDALGGVTAMNWDSDMNLVGVTDANEHTSSYEYDTYGNLISQTGPTGNSTCYGWDVINSSTDYIALLASTTNARGFTTNYEYAARDNLIRTTEATGNSSSFDYDAFGDMISATDFRGCTTLYDYDTHGNLVNSIDAAGHTTEYTYDTVGRLLTVTDANGHTITNEYDDNDRLVKVIDALGNETVCEYNAGGSLISTTDANGHKTSTNSNIIGRVEGITDPTGNKTSFKYDKKGNLIEYSTAKGSSTTTEYDALGRVVAVIDAVGNAENYSYDAVGNLITVTDRNGGVTTYTYDALDRLVAMTGQLGHTTTYAYDPVSNILSVQDQNGEITCYEYDARDRVTLITDAMGNEDLFSYDANGNLLSYTDAKGHATKYEYDRLNRRIKAISPLGFQTQYDYDPVGNVISKEDANGNTTLYDYDAVDRLVLTTYPNSGKVKREYDAVGNLIQISNIGIGLNDVTKFSYDELDRLTAVTRNYGSFPKSVNYTYDENSNLATMRDPDGRITAYQCDEIDRLVDITDPYGKVTRYQYDKGGRRIAMQRPNGVTTRYSYDAANRLLCLVNKKSSVDVISSYTYIYDNVGNRLSMTEADGNVTCYGYDALNRLVNATYPSGEFTQYAYDAVGNRLSKTNSTSTVLYTYDADNRLLAANGVSYTYDNNGNLVSKSDGTNYEYDYENRLIKVTLPDTSQVTYQYSANGDRLSRTNSSGTTTYYLCDLANLLMELDVKGVQKARYTHGLGIDEPISMHRGGGILYYQFDGLGSVTSLTDINENVVATYKYEAFGTIREEIGTVINPYKFTCREYDDDSGLYYYRARWYNANLGRFLSKDSLGKTYHNNLYTYAENNPIVYTDPSGHMYVPVLTELGGAADNFCEQFLPGLAAHNARMRDYVEHDPETLWGAGSFDMWAVHVKPGAFAQKMYEDPGGFFAEIAGGAIDAYTLGVGTSSAKQAAILGAKRGAAKETIDQVLHGELDVENIVAESTIDALFSVTAYVTSGEIIKKLQLEKWSNYDYVQNVPRVLKGQPAGGQFLPGRGPATALETFIFEHSAHLFKRGFVVGRILYDSYYTSSLSDGPSTSYFTYPYGGTDTTSIEDWPHFSIHVASEKPEYNRGETVSVTISVRNKAEPEIIWLGVSFKDPTGESAKYDLEITITPESATIDHDNTKTFTAEWIVPEDAPAGVYKIAVNCWMDNTFTDRYSDDLEWASIFNVPTEAGKYWKEIIINENSGKTLTDYQIMVDLRGADFPDNAKSDGADIRFYDAEGEELSYWIEEYDYGGKHAKIWVKVPGIPANGETRIMMYYGDEKAETVSDGDKVFGFFDDFEDGDISDWWGTASVVDFRGRKWIKMASGWGKYVGISHKMPLHDNFAIEFLEYENSGEQDDYDLGVDLYEDQGSIRIAYMVGDNFDRHNLPKARLKHLESITCGILACWQEPAGENCQICAEEQNLGIFAECTQRSTAIKSGENLVLKTEGTYSANLHGTHNLGIFNAVSLAFGEFCGTKKVDFVAVRKYTSPEPTITIGT